MMGLASIITANEKATRKAKENNKQPYVATKDFDEGVFQCPNLGDYTPNGWIEIDKLFVDSSGFGSINEPALTKDQFINRIRKGYGYGISEAGQFQVYIKVLKRI